MWRRKGGDDERKEWVLKWIRKTNKKRKEKYT
jgi:hypothetical protein